MDRYERIEDIKQEFKKNIKRMDTLIDSCSRKEDFKYALEVMKLYFYTRDKISDLMPKIFRM